MYVADLVIAENALLGPWTTLGVGGPSRYSTRVDSVDAVEAALQWAEERALPVLVLGQGSNLLVSDDGFPGLVVRVGLKGVTVTEDADTVEVTAAAGESWSALVNRAVARGWAGVECLAGIPGLVGATPVQNVGAYGQEVCDTVARVEAYDRLLHQRVTFTNDDCAFGYRESRFKREDHGRYLITAVTYRLRRDGLPTVQYVELERTLAAWEIARPTLQDVRRAVVSIRRMKSMLLSPEDPNARSAGSFFMNPMLPADQMAALDAAIGRALPGARIPRFAHAGGYKIPAAWLIERAGFSRGHAAGPVGLSDNHALAIVNRGGATARDVLALARSIRAGVHDRFGVWLQPEPVLVGVSLEGEE